MIQEISNVFKTKTTHAYPPHNNIIFEEYFYNYMINNDPDTDRYYLPVLWTNFYLSRGNGDGNMVDLQQLLDGLDRKKKYFTVLQYDDGILQNLSDLDILVFGAGGGGAKNMTGKNLGDVKIPLICRPNPTINKNQTRYILASFVGALNGRHVVRDKMANILNSDPNMIIKSSSGYNTFVDVMEKSLFSLCPRGYGATSFRICESLQYGSIPIYIYDEPWIPWENDFDFNDVGILCHADDLSNLPLILKNKTNEDIKRYQENGEKIYNEFFDYDGCSKKIIEKCVRMD